MSGGVRAGGDSSSPELSSPPRSPSDPGSPSAHQLASESQSNARNAAAPITSGVEEPQKPPRKKPGRKPKNAQPEATNNSTATTIEVPKTRKPRKPREAKDPNLAPVQRKKKSLPGDGENGVRVASGATRQLKAAHTPSPMPESIFHVPANATTATSGKSEDIPKPAQTVLKSFFAAAPQQQVQHQQPAPQQSQQVPAQQIIASAPVQSSAPAPPPAPAPARSTSSGQNYDPIRSSNYDAVRETIVNHNVFPATQMSPRTTQVVNRASASPSISSLIDPPHQAATSPNVAGQSFFSHVMRRQGQTDSVTSTPPSPTLNRPQQTSTTTQQTQSSPQPSVLTKVERPADQPTPLPEGWPKITAPAAPTYSSLSVNGHPGQGHFSTIGSSKPKPNSTATSSASHSPKPARGMDITPPPLPGSGAISLFGGAQKDGTETRAPTIVLNISLNPQNPNHYVNFTRLAEERYGWDALHPRLAAQRERLARVAAASDALEKGGAHRESGDEMSLDMADSDGENSNVEMGGMSDARTGTDKDGVKKTVRKRKRREDEYDKDDGFVDDSELLWEEQAAASKDGFFVYSGPLVPEGEKPAERPDGPPKRGRGRGRGSSTRGSTGTRGGGIAGTSGGPGSRGGTTTRKPRITKADRARMEIEKREREQMGLAGIKSGPGFAAGQVGYAGQIGVGVGPAYGPGPVLASAVGGGVPLVFNQ